MEKKKWYATMAAVLLLAATGCSDDFENGNNSGTNEEEGNKAYMTVNISTVSDGPMTKATNDKGAGWGEDGNDFLGELAGKKEAMVYDINVFLVKVTTPNINLTTSNHLNYLNTKSEPEKITIDGYGYYNLDAPIDASTGGNEPNHGSRNIKITMNRDLGETAEYFQVFTIVNAGQDLSEVTPKIATLKDLRDYIHTGAVYQGDNVTDADKFVMSTHKMVSNATQANYSSVVALSNKNTEENPAQTSVYVERLSARIDLSYPTGTLEFDNDASPVDEQGTFKLTGYMIVNQWNGKTNMFKQVSPIVTDWSQEINLTTATYGENDPQKYLGDEAWAVTTQPSTGRFNFVLSDEFTNKIATDADKAEKNWGTFYTNHFSTDLNDDKKLTGLPVTTNVSYTEGAGTDAKTFYPIAYVRENTMNTKAQVNGYTTGVIFRTQFTPDESFKMMEYLSEASGEFPAGSISDQATLESTTKFEFLTAEHYDGKEVQKLVYKDVKTVAAKAFKLANGETKGLLKGFMDSWEGNTTATLTDIQGAVNDMSEKNLLSQKFKTYLNEQLKDKSNLDEELKKALTYDAFVGKQDADDKALLTTSLDQYTTDQIYLLAKDYGIYFFRNGQSYHKFWIRHDDNMDDNKMGVMEFAIVRNNVYQLNVTGVRGLGDPLPFTPGKDDPKNPDESNKVTINVTIYVKDWVKRTNKDIIL